jgi:hypothetical protein
MTQLPNPIENPLEIRDQSPVRSTPKRLKLCSVVPHQN